MPLRMLTSKSSKGARIYLHLGEAVKLKIERKTDSGVAGTAQKEKCLPNAGARAGEYKRGDLSRDMWKAVVSPGPWQELAPSGVCLNRRLQNGLACSLVSLGISCPQRNFLFMT